MVPSATATDMPSRASENLEALACRAAIDVDNLQRQRSWNDEAMRGLIDALSRRVTDVAQPSAPNSLLDTTTAVAVHHAIESAYSQSSKRVDELVAQTGQITSRLKELVDNPNLFRDQNNDELSRLRAFCVALSRSVSASTQPPRYTRSQHPFRR